MRYLVFLLGLGGLSFFSMSFVGKNLLQTVQSSVGAAAAARPAADSSLSSEEREMLKDVSASVEIKRGELVDRLLKNQPGNIGALPEYAATAGQIAGSAGRNVLAFYAKYRTALISIIWMLPVFALGLGGAFLLFGYYSGALACCGFSFRASAITLWLLSAAVVAAHIFANINLLLILAPGFWLLPAALILVSIFALRRLDMNYPVWNEMVSAMFMPLVASIVVAGWGHFYPFFVSMAHGGV